MTANNTGGGLFGTPQPGLGRGGGGLANPGGGGLFGRTAGGGLFGSGGGGGGGLFSQTPAASQSGGLTGGLVGTGTGLFQTPQSEEIMLTVLSMTLLTTPPPLPHHVVSSEPAKARWSVWSESYAWRD